VTTMTKEQAGARRQESQKRTRMAPAASRNALRPRSREQLLFGVEGRGVRWVQVGMGEAGGEHWVCVTGWGAKAALAGSCCGP